MIESFIRKKAIGQCHRCSYANARPAASPFCNNAGMRVASQHSTGFSCRAADAATSNTVAAIVNLLHEAVALMPQSPFTQVVLMLLQGCFPLIKKVLDRGHQAIKSLRTLH